MSPRTKQAARVVAAFLVIALVQVYVLADATRPTATSNATVRTEPASMIFGTLTLPGSRLIFVNGNNAGSGTTIFSGAQLQTPEAIEATVLLGAIGRLDIAPNSNLTLTFDKASVDVLVMAGNAVLSTNDGIVGTVRSPDGKVERSGSSNNPAAAKAVVGLAPVRRAARAAATSTEEKASLIIIPIVIAAIIIAVAAKGGGNNDDNVSLSTP